MLEKIRSMLPKSVKARMRPYYKFLSGSVSLVKIGISKAIRVVHRPKMPNSEKGVFVNLGCGMTCHPEFINVDGLPHPHVHFVHRIDRLPMFADSSVDLIYASHCLEHFRYQHIDKVLSEWARVIKSGGLLRLSVPDFDKLLAIYNATGNPDDIVAQVMGGQENRYNFHYVLFNKKNLTDYLIRAGFADIHEWVPGSSDLTTFSDFSVYQKDIRGNKYEISLNIEARKI